MKGTVLKLVLDTANLRNTYRTLSLQNNWGTAAKPVYSHTKV